MADNILQTFEHRREFVAHLEGDIQKNSKAIEERTNQLNKLQETITNVKTLGEYPEHTCLIPLAKNIYMKGNIVHTGEHYVKKNASPESYILLKPLEQTINSLQEEIKVKEDEIDKIEYANFQLEERMKLLKVEEVGVLDDEKLPKEIKSDKGVAMRVGEFYEILEFEED